MADEAKTTNTPEYGCFSDLSEQQAATAEQPKKAATKTEPEAAPVENKE